MCADPGNTGALDIDPLEYLTGFIGYSQMASDNAENSDDFFITVCLFQKVIDLFQRFEKQIYSLVTELITT